MPRQAILSNILSFSRTADVCFFPDYGALDKFCAKANQLKIVTDILVINFSSQFFSDKDT